MVQLTTSWDDADPLDLRLAAHLAQRDIKGTFYLCREFEGRAQMPTASIRELAALPGVEIGAHTLTHPDLRRLDDRRLRDEVHGSKVWLEDIVQTDVLSFAYPRGLHNRRVVECVAESGFEVGRTTMGGCVSTKFPSVRMPTTLQLYPHSRWTQARHALKERDFRGLQGILRVETWSRDPQILASSFLSTARTTDPLIHVWGHSWEIEEFDLWEPLERLLDWVGNIEATPLTNHEVVDLLGRDGGR